MKLSPVRLKQDSPFFKLPAELRNEIYVLALIDANFIEIKNDVQDRRMDQSRALLRTCREICAEGNPIYYAGNSF